MSSPLFRHITVAFLLLLAHGLLRAQQVFPVSVSGNLVPPHSLVLSDYATTRTQDLSFMLTLNDPVEATRLVKFRLSIRQDGNEIMATNPNYNPPPVLLERQVPYIIDGGDLAGYLNPANLLYAGGGQPGVLLPSGFNSFCLEVIDVQRNVPISDRFCASGFFELAQPPLLDLPLCNSLLSFSEPQNITFSWMPMHLLSLNQPVDVQYEFTLVKMLPGIQDPNDGFNFSTPILQRIVSQNVLHYLEDDPLLEQDGLYAWRVRALDGRGYDLFQNHGYSQVCTFAFQGGGQLGSPLFSCEGGDCQWNGTLATNPLTAALAIGDEVTVGFFNMRLTEVQPNGQGGYSGAGTIYIPFLYSKLRVEFTNIQVNQARRMYAGDIRSVAENADLIPSFFSVINPSTLVGAATQAAADFSDQTAQALETYFTSGDLAHPPNLVSTLQNSIEANALPVGLPIGLDQTIPGSGVRMTVAVTGIHFDAHSAAMNAVLSTRFGTDGPWVKFGAKGLCLQPYGLAVSAPTLSLLADVDLTGTVLPIKILGLNASGEPGTHLSWNCEGFEQFVLKGSYAFSRDRVRPVADPAGTVVATFTATTRRLDDFMVKMDGLVDFYIPGAEDFPFHIGDLWLDLSKTANPTGLEFPEGYPAASSGVEFRGLYLHSAAVGLPPVFQNSTAGTLPKLTANSLLFDQNGLTGRITGENLINLSTGNLGGWGYSLDSSWLNLVANSFVNSGFTGKMRLPIMAPDESLHYVGSFAPAALQNAPMDISFHVAPDVVTIDLLKARIVFDPGSSISVGRLNGVFQSPKADLSGLLTAAVTSGDPGFAGHIMQEIQSLQQTLTAAGLGSVVPKLDMDGIRFTGLKIDLAAADKFQIESIVPQNASLQFLGFNADLSTMNFSSLDAAQLATMGITAAQNVLSRGLQFHVDIARDLLGSLAPTATFTVVVNESPNGSGGTKYAFGGFDLQFAGPNVTFNCAANLDPLPAPGNPATGNIQGQFAQLKTGYFTLTPNFPLTADNGAGTISGTGKIDVDILGPFRTLNVTFNAVKVDQSGRIIEGEVITGGGAGLFNSPNLSGVLSNVQGQVDAMVNGMNSFNLPVVLGVQGNGESERDQGLIIMGLVFKPTEAKAQAKVIFPAGGGQFAEFVIEGLTMVPNGVANFDLAVGLAHDLNFQPVSGLNPLIFKHYNSADHTGSFIRLDCHGFLEFNLAGSYAFPQSQLVSLDHPGQPVVANFNVNSQKWGDFMGQLDSLGAFELATMPGFAFHVSDAYLDFSQTRNPSPLVFPNNYNSGATATAPFNWRGFFIKQIGLTLPDMFALSGGTPPSFSGENLLIDAQGASATLIGRNVVDGNIDGWGFALDSLGLTIVANQLTEGGLSGHLEVPLVDDPLPYSGALTRDAQGFFTMTLQPSVTTQLNISALKSHITLNDSTVVTLTTVPDPKPGKPNNRKFKPYADLYGSVGSERQQCRFSRCLPDG